MATTETVIPPQQAPHPPAGPFKRWLLEGYINKPEAAHIPENAPHHQHSWWQVMCLTGVDYFSTLGYQPGIAALAAGALSPVATLVLVLLTLFGALPMYKRVARASPHGDGSISMLEHLLKWWQGKLFVLALIGFAATGFIITITLSAADATAHIIENPFAPAFLHGHEVLLTIVLIALLGAVFLKGFGEAINIAVALVAAYIALNLIVIGTGFAEIVHRPEVLADWQRGLFRSYGNPLLMIGAALLVFPKLALGLSGFETGVVVMPLVKGAPGDTPENPEGRIRNTHKLLTTAAVIMSVLLLASSVVTTLLIPADAFREATATQPAGEASGRALAYLAHEKLGDAFGTAYDISTVMILWFAGASAMAGLLNIVPRYLPRYGMSPEWTRAVRPLVLIFTGICFLVTVLFKADVAAQAGAYATGVLALMTSATVAVTIGAVRAKQMRAAAGFGLVTLIFLYTTLVNVREQPEGIKIAGFFIAAIVAVSLVSRVWRTLELRVSKIELDEMALRIIDEAVQRGTGELRLIPNHPDSRAEAEYAQKARQAREDHQILVEEPLLFFEGYVQDASHFSDVMRVKGVRVGGYRVLRAESTAIPNAIAAFLLYLRDQTGMRPHAYFNWTEGNPLIYLIRYMLSGQGDIAPVTREVLRQAEPDHERRPAVHAAM